MIIISASCAHLAQQHMIFQIHRKGFNYLCVKSPHVNETPRPIFNKIMTKCSVYFFLCRVHVRQSESPRVMISRWNIDLRGTWWHTGRVEAFRPENFGFDSCTGHHFEYLRIIYEEIPLFWRKMNIFNKVYAKWVCICECSVQVWRSENIQVVVYRCNFHFLHWTWWHIGRVEAFGQEGLDKILILLMKPDKFATY